MSNVVDRQKRRELVVAFDRRTLWFLFFLFFFFFVGLLSLFPLCFSLSISLFYLPDDNYISISESSTQSFEFLIIVPNLILRSQESTNSCPLKGTRVKTCKINHHSRVFRFEGKFFFWYAAVPDSGASPN